MDLLLSGLIGGGELLLLAPLLAFLFVLPFWKIFEKAGYQPWVSLGMLVPLVNLFLLYKLAFSDWPVLRGDATRGTA
jgi:hypothetical protein